MTQQPTKHEIDLNAIAVANGCQEVAAFDLSVGGATLPALHYSRVGNQPTADETQAALKALETIAKIFLPASQDAYVEIVGVSTGKKPIYGLLIFARHAGNPVCVAVFVKACDTVEVAEQTLQNLQTQLQHFRGS
jgi:hypothetical protein